MNFAEFEDAEADYDGFVEAQTQVAFRNAKQVRVELINAFKTWFVSEFPHMCLIAQDDIGAFPLVLHRLPKD